MPSRAACPPPSHPAARVRARVGAARRQAAVAAGLGLLAGGPAQALDTQLQLAAASRLTERGLIVGRERPVLQLQLGVASAGGSSAELAWAAQAGSLRDARLVARLGQAFTIDNDWQADAALAYYGYPGRGDSRYDRIDLAVGLRWRDLFSLGLSGQRYRDSADGGDGTLPWALDLGARWPLAALGPRWSLQGTLGQASVPRWPRERYGYGSLGLAWQHEQGGGLSLSRIAASPAARRRLGDSARSHWSLAWTQAF